MVGLRQRDAPGSVRADESPTRDWDRNVPARIWALDKVDSPENWTLASGTGWPSGPTIRSSNVAADAGSIVALLVNGAGLVLPSSAARGDSAKNDVKRP